MPREIGRARSTSTEEKTEGRQRVTKDSASTSIGSGWASERRQPKVKRPDRPNRLSVDEGKEVLIKFLEDRPFASYYQHWVPGATANKRKPYTCVIDNCPLCNIGDVPKPVECFNVIEMTETPQLLLWQLSADPSKAVKARADSKRTAPLNREDLYFAVSKSTGSNGFATYSVDPVKADELEGDWGLQPLTDEQLAELAKGAYTEDIAQAQPRHELQEYVDGLED